jgi:CheY-like chemotaxis protein
MYRSNADPNHNRRLLMASLPEGFSMLIVEENMILALDVEDMLLRNGATRVDVVCTGEEALHVLETTRYQAAVLDLNLSQGSILPVAARLVELGVPFAFCASHGERILLPEPYTAAALIHTPCNEAYLMSALGKLLDVPSAR